MRRTAALVLAFATSLAMTMPAVARADEVAPILTGADALDSQTYARPQVARVTHVALDLDADFQNRRMAGTATLDVQAAAGAREIILDSKGLEIEAVTDGSGAALQYALGANDAAKGAPLTIRFADGAAPAQRLHDLPAQGLAELGRQQAGEAPGRAHIG